MTDMNLNTADATEVAATEVLTTPIDKFLAGSKSLHKAFAKIAAGEETLSNQRIVVQQLREDVTAALNGKGDFDEASKAFKQGNNKLDKLMDANSATLKSALIGINALRFALDDLEDDLRMMEV